MMDTVVNLEELKAAVIADESRFQNACSAWVYRYIGECVSSLMYDVGQNLEQCSNIFDFDYEEATSWFQSRDWESAVEEFIRRDADYTQLEEIADKVGYWADICEEVGVSISAWEALKEKLEQLISLLEDEQGEHEEDSKEWDSIQENLDQLQAEFDAIDSFEDWVRQQDKDEDLREAIIDAITNDSEYQEVGEEMELDPDYDEVYEHWTIPEGFTARLLRQHGQVVFDFGGLTIWGRMTTGQSISMDGVIRRIVAEEDADHWVWKEA